MFVGVSPCMLRYQSLARYWTGVSELDQQLEAFLDETRLRECFGPPGQTTTSPNARVARFTQRTWFVCGPEDKKEEVLAMISLRYLVLKGACPTLEDVSELLGVIEDHPTKELVLDLSSNPLDLDAEPTRDILSKIAELLAQSQSDQRDMLLLRGIVERSP